MTLTVAALIIPFSGIAQESQDDARGELSPRLATLAKDTTLADALAALHTQTGNDLKDLRKQPANPGPSVVVEKASFWQALDLLAQREGANVSPYAVDGAAAFIDGPTHKMPVCYPGIFRVAAKSVSASHNWETETHTLGLNLEIAWEPRFQPLYCDRGPIAVTYEDEPTFTAPGRGAVNVTGRGAVEVEATWPAPARTVTAIKSVTGSFKVIGPSKMLTFTFDTLKAIKKEDAPRAATIDGVRVTLTKLVAGPDRWSVALTIDNPPGGPVFESYQSWLGNNQIWLERTVGTKREIWRPAPADQRELAPLTASRALLEYFFRDPQLVKSSKLADWALCYRTPGRIVELELPYTLKDLPLP